MIYEFQAGEDYRWTSANPSDYDDCFCTCIKVKETPDAFVIWVRWYLLSDGSFVMDQKNLAILKSNLGEWHYGKSGPH